MAGSRERPRARHERIDTGHLQTLRVGRDHGRADRLCVGFVLALGASARAGRDRRPPLPGPKPRGATPGSVADANEPMSDATAAHAGLRPPLGRRRLARSVRRRRSSTCRKGTACSRSRCSSRRPRPTARRWPTWDHPGIHYNLALALLNMDQPVEVYQNLENAIKYGAEPLDPGEAGACEELPAPDREAGRVRSTFAVTSTARR